MKLSEAAANVINLATKIRNYWDAELPKRHPNYPFVSAGEDSGPPPPEEKQLKQFLAKLSDDDIYKLLLITYLGRGDFGTDNLAGQYEYLKGRFAKPESAVAQMMGKAPLAEYLTDGMAEAKKCGINIDHLTFTSVGSGS